MCDTEYLKKDLLWKKFRDKGNNSVNPIHLAKKKKKRNTNNFRYVSTHKFGKFSVRHPPLKKIKYELSKLFFFWGGGMIIAFVYFK